MQLYVWIHKWRRVILKALNLEMLIAEVWQNFWALKINCSGNKRLALEEDLMEKHSDPLWLHWSPLGDGSPLLLDLP